MQNVISVKLDIKWISKDNIDDYMVKNQHEQNASLLWQYYQAVIAWVESTFNVKRKSMNSRWKSNSI